MSAVQDLQLTHTGVAGELARPERPTRPQHVQQLPARMRSSASPAQRLPARIRSATSPGGPANSPPARIVDEGSEHGAKSPDPAGSTRFYC